MQKHELKTLAKRVWKFLWVEDSWASLAANAIIAFVIIKFIFYPVLGIILGTPYPIVAVVSGSMEHDLSFDQWWESACTYDTGTKKYLVHQRDFYIQTNITKNMFQTYPFNNGFNKGDLMILYSSKYATTGDIIVYLIPGKNDPIIHRVIAVSQNNSGKLFKTKGDHNCGIGEFEHAIPENKVMGKAVIRVPFLGWIKLLFVDLIKLVRG